MPTNAPTSVIRLTPDTPLSKSELDELIARIRPHCEVELPEQRDFGASVAIAILVLKLIGASAGAATAISKLSRELVAWRDRLKDSQRKPGRLESAKQPSLDLAVATPEQVEKWLTEQSQPR